MSTWKVLSPQRKKKLNFGAMMFVAREARKLDLLNFIQGEFFCLETVSFTVDVGDGVTGTVNLTPRQGEPELVHVVLESDAIYIQSHLLKVGVMFEPWSHFIPENIYSKGGIPNAIVDMALNPATMQEVFE